MKKLFFIIMTSLCVLNSIQSQNTGIGTENPQATLDVNGTFKTEHGVIVNGISADSVMLNASDSLLPTQMAVRHFMKQGKWIREEGQADSVYLVTSQSDSLAYIQKVVEQNGFAYVLTFNGLFIFDVSDPDTIIPRDSTNALFGTGINGAHCDLEVQGNVAYVSSYAKGFIAAYDVSNPDSIIYLCRNSDGGKAFRSFVVDGNYLYAATFNWSISSIIIYDISDPDSMLHKFTFQENWVNNLTMIEKTGRWIWALTPFGNFINGTSDLFRFDALDPDTLIYNNHNSFGGEIVHTATSGDRIYITLKNGGEATLQMFKTSQSSAQLTSGGSVDIPLPTGLHAEGNELYLAVYGDFNGNAHVSAVINFDISTSTPKPKWVHEAAMFCPHTISHTRFLGSLDRLFSFNLFPRQHKRDLIRQTDGSLKSMLSFWHTDTLFNVIAEDGYIGIGTEDPLVKLDLHGDQYIDSTYSIEFGGDISGKGLHAGTIGNGTLSGDALDIVGGGPPDNRRTDFYGEGGITITGKLKVEKETLHKGVVVAEKGFYFPEHVGIGTSATPDQALLVKDGVSIHSESSALPGIWLNRPGNNVAEANFIGDRGDQTGGLKTTSGWNILRNAELKYGFGMNPSSDLLSVGGSCKTAYLHVNDSATWQGGLRVKGNQSLSLRGPWSRYGWIVYTPDALDIIAQHAFADNLGKTMYLKAEGGITVDGSVHIANVLQASSVSTQAWTDLTAGLQNGWINYGDGFATISMYRDPGGVVHLRGLIKNGLNQQNTVIVNLPAGYRPVDGHQIFAVPNGVNTAGRIDIKTNGDVVFQGGTNTFISLDQISFKTN